MRCPACQRENPSENRFCGGCGAPLSRSCPSCAAPNAPDQAFCGQCGTRLEAEARAHEGPPSKQAPGAAAAAAPEAELRHLTVMFCDLVGSTELSQRLDAEELREVVRAYQERAGEVVARFEGYVAQYLGDGLLAYFGYPEAHEDDAERAVRAALGIVEGVAKLNPRLEQKHGVGLALRVGIHTGPVVVGEMGGSERRETLALGDTANVAARLPGEAEPDTVVVSPATLRLVQGIFVTRDLGARGMKGVEEPLHVHQVVRPSGIRSRLDVVGATGLTPLVGRDQELMLLDDRWAQVREGWGQAVLIFGEAGIGKSRLMQAFRERLAERAHTWLECRCSPYTQESALHPVLELQRQALGFEAGEAAETKLERLEAGLRAAEFDLPQALPLMAAFHSLALPDRYEEPVLSPEGRRKQTLELLAAWLLRLGRDQPVVLLMEDLHWMDPSTLELLGGILEQIARAPVLLLLTYRPDFEPPWGTRSNVTPVLLARLTRGQMGDLIRKAAREQDLPDAWVAEIVRRADGVPLFAEELTRAVLESNPDLAQADATPGLHIPETLQDSLTARLDALGPVKELAQLGAVLGREFSYELLLEVSPLKETQLREALAEAVREELFYQQGAPPEATYLFKHALIRDAAYRSLLRATRRRHHKRVADTLIDRMPEVVEAQPELVAYHLTEAGDGEPAITYWQRAGERANARAANEEAIRHLQRGLALVRSLPESLQHEAELGLQVSLGKTLVAARGWGHLETVDAWERAKEICDPAAHPEQSAAIRYGLGDMHETLAQPSAALVDYSQVLRIGEQSGDDLLIVAGHNGIGQALHYLGRFGESRDHLERAMTLYDARRHASRDEIFSEDLGVNLLNWAGWTLWYAGFPDRACAAAAEAIALARRKEKPFDLALALAWAAAAGLLRRDWTAAHDCGAEAANLGGDQGFPMIEAVGRMAQATSEGLEKGDPDAIDQLAAAMAQAAESGNQGAAPLILGFLAELRLAAGKLRAALETVEGALANAQQTGQAFRDAELHRLKGEIFLKLPDHSEDEAEALFHEAIGIARRQEAKSLEVRAATSLARLWQRQGKCREARDLLAPIYDWFTEGFDTPDLKDAQALLEELA